MKIVINKCYGGFGLSAEAVKHLIAKDSPLINKTTYHDYTGGRCESVLKDEDWKSENIKSAGDGFYSDGFIEHVLYDKSGETVWVDNSRDTENRTHPDLIEVVEILGDEASSKMSKLEIVEIPDGVQWEIDEYDGNESIEENHRSWR